VNGDEYSTTAVMEATLFIEVAKGIGICLVLIALRYLQARATPIWKC
jgi:hypothetical protein